MDFMNGIRSKTNLRDPVHSGDQPEYCINPFKCWKNGQEINRTARSEDFLIWDCSSIFRIINPFYMKHFLTVLQSLLLILFLDCVPDKTTNEEISKYPNILLIISDDQAWTDYSF